MNIFWVFNGRKIKRTAILIAACLFAIAVVIAEKDDVPVFSQSQAPAAVYSVVTTNPWIALTFDISWGEERAPSILQALKDNQVEKTTFFLSSLWSKDHPDIVERIVEAGFEIGSHGYEHKNYSELNDEDIRKQISIAHQILTEQIGEPPHLIRMPNGDFDQRVLRIANELNYQVIQWDTDSHDWTNPGVDRIVQQVVSRAHNGNIVLMHASDASEQTAEALPIIIKQLREQGYEFTTVSEMLNQAKVQGKPVHDR